MLVFLTNTILTRYVRIDKLYQQRKRKVQRGQMLPAHCLNASFIKEYFSPLKPVDLSLHDYISLRFMYVF